MSFIPVRVKLNFQHHSSIL